MQLLLQVPHDALDLALNSVYAHGRDTLVSKMYVPIQPETLGRETWRVLRNKIKVLRIKYVNAFDNIKCQCEKQANMFEHFFRFYQNRLNQIDRGT